MSKNLPCVGVYVSLASLFRLLTQGQKKTFSLGLVKQLTNTTSIACDIARQKKLYLELSDYY